MAKSSKKAKHVPFSLKNFLIMFIAIGTIVGLAFYVGRITQPKAQYYNSSWTQQVSAIGNKAGYRAVKTYTDSARFCPGRNASEVTLKKTNYYLNYIVERNGYGYSLAEKTTVYGYDKAANAIKWYCTINRDKYGLK